MDRRRQAAASRRISACATTSRRPSVRKEPDTLARGARDECGSTRAASRPAGACRGSAPGGGTRRRRRRSPRPPSRSSSISSTRSSRARRQRRAAAAWRRPARGQQPGQDLLAEAEADQGRPVPPLRARRAVILPVLADRPLVMKRYPERRRGEAVLPASRAGQAAARRPRRDGRERHRDAGRTSSAAIARRRCCTRAQLAVDLAGPLVLPRRLAGHGRSHRHRPRSAGRPAVRTRARRGALGARGARRAEGARLSQDVRLRRPAHLRADAAGHAVRGRPALRADRRDDGREEASEGGHRRAIDRGARPAHLRGLPAEHPGQDAGERLQRARQRLRRRLDAADVGRGRRRRLAEGFHDAELRGAAEGGRRSLGAAAEVEGRGPARGDEIRERRRGGPSGPRPMPRSDRDRSEREAHLADDLPLHDVAEDVLLHFLVAEVGDLEARRRPCRRPSARRTPPFTSV